MLFQIWPLNTKSKLIFILQKDFEHHLTTTKDALQKNAAATHLHI